LIASPEVDAIYNPLPNSEHAEWSIKCAEAGKPVLCEKPLASNAAEAQKMIDAFASRNVLFAEAFMWRFHPQSQRVKQMVDDGAVGEMRLVESALDLSDWQRGRHPVEQSAGWRVADGLGMLLRQRDALHDR